MRIRTDALDEINVSNIQSFIGQHDALTTNMNSTP